MLIRILFRCIVLSCLVIPWLHAKTFSLNDFIEAEERQRILTTTPRVSFATNERSSINSYFKSKSVKPKKFKRKTGFFTKPLHLNTHTEEQEKKTGKINTWPSLFSSRHLAETSKRFALNEVFAPNPQSKSKQLKKSGQIYSKGKKLPSLKLKKTFKIKSPLKPSKLKYSQKLGDRDDSTKEISEDEKLFRKYLPLLRSLDMLFDNILDKGSGDSRDATRINFGENCHRIFTKGHTTCTCCYDGSDSETDESATAKAAVVTVAAPNEITATEPLRTEAPPSGAYYTTVGDVSSVGQNSDLPPVLARNPVSFRRNDIGVSSGSRPTLHSSAEGNISGDHRNSEYDTRSGENRARAKSYEKDSYSSSRDDANSARFRGGGRGDRTHPQYPVYRRGFDNTHDSTKSEKGFRNTGRNFVKPEGKDQLEDRRDKTESSEFVPKFLRGDRGYVSEDNFDYNPEPDQPEEFYEKRDKSIELNVPGNQRFSFGNDASSSEDQKTHETNTAAVMSIDDLNNDPMMVRNSPKPKAPYVTIFDGYSVARDKNGSNKLAEHSIRVHT